MRHLSSVVLSIVAVCGLSLGQCSSLAVSGSVNPGQTVSISVSGGTPNAIALLAAGPDAGSTSIMVPGSILVLSLAEPFAILPLGPTDASGAVSLSLDIPANVPASSIPNETFILQAVIASFSLGMPPSFSFCVSNTAMLVSGTG